MAGHSIDSPVTLEALQRLVGQLVCVPATQNVWVTAELSDVAVRGGHCYLELLQKDAATGRQIAKARGIIWANIYPSIAHTFRAATGQEFCSGIKVMLRVSVSFHAVFGMSLVISAVNPDYTLGDLMRRRREILERLHKEGVLEANRQLSWPEVPRRLAVISAPGAAGYGDFINQLFHNRFLLRFKVRLFEAVMQGERAPRSIIDALEAILADGEEWDGVVIIRGGGATSDLAAFEDYDLASSIAQFPLPVIIGIGHERDITVLDYVANMRVKTPTAAAEWLIGRGEQALARLQTLANDIYRTVSDRIAGHLRQLAYMEGLLPILPLRVTERASERLRVIASNLAKAATGRIAPEKGRIESLPAAFSQAATNIIARRRDRLDSMQTLLDALSPQATLARGYSITTLGGVAVRDASTLSPGDTLVTTLAEGTVTSTVTLTSQQSI